MITFFVGLVSGFLFCVSLSVVLFHFLFICCCCFNF